MKIPLPAATHWRKAKIMPHSLRRGGNRGEFIISINIIIVIFIMLIVIIVTIIGIIIIIIIHPLIIVPIISSGPRLCRKYRKLRNHFISVHEMYLSEGQQCVVHYSTILQLGVTS